MPIRLSSTAFEQNGEIPVVHTCDGPGVAPPLAWTGAPAGTRAYALIADDPDAPDPAAPTRTFVHWVVYGIAKSATSLEGNGYREGLNDRKQTGYTGPCPPKGRHRYFFKLYALDVVLGDLGETTKSDLEQAMRGHVLEHAELIGTYERGGALK
jgi:Raf kinase inhibitor-like YbhB/YbcL family protein